MRYCPPAGPPLSSSLLWFFNLSSYSFALSLSFLSIYSRPSLFFLLLISLSLATYSAVPLGTLVGIHPVFFIVTTLAHSSDRAA